MSQSETEFRRALLRWYREHGRDLPWRRTCDPYRILISEIMLQQTTVATVRPRYESWIKRFPSASALARARESEVLHAWQGLGYYTRARNLHRCAQMIVAQYGGEIPKSIAQLQTLPGLGRYTANAVAVFAFNRPRPLIEANTARVFARISNLRLPIDTTLGRERLWQLSADLTPARRARDFHNALMDLGALVCSPRNPQCGICPVRKFCRAPAPEELPRKRARPSLIEKVERHEFLRTDDRVVLERARERWCGLWILPPTNATAGKVLHRRRFPFTHHRISLEILRGRPRPLSPHERAFTFDQLSKVPMPSPHRRALEALLA